MTLARLTSTRFCLEPDDDLVVGFDPFLIDSLRRLELRFYPARGGVRFRGEVYTHPLPLYERLSAIIANLENAAEQNAERAESFAAVHPRAYESARWFLADVVEFYRVVRREILRRDFLRRYWPTLVDEVDEVHEQARRRGGQGVAHEGESWRARAAA